MYYETEERETSGQTISSRRWVGKAASLGKGQRKKEREQACAREESSPFRDHSTLP